MLGGKFIAEGFFPYGLFIDDITSLELNSSDRNDFSHDIDYELSP